MNKINLLTKAIGLTGAGVILYDMHNAGKMLSQHEIKNGIGSRLPDAYISSRRQETFSTVTSKIKDRVFAEHVNFALPDRINAVTGYLKGAFNQLSSDIVPAILATGALIKNKFSGAFAAGLGIYSIYYLLGNVFNIGRINHFKD